MHIPDKYRKMYDNLALTHPWMREMRDETETIGDLIEKRKKEIEERNHLIAKARNSFKSLAESNYDYAKFRKACRRATEIMDAEMGSMGIASDGRALEAADEPTNGIDGETNGITDDAPLVDEPPESDAIEHARWRWKYRPEDGDEVVMSEYNCNLLMSDLDAIADMVERDYVSRAVYSQCAKVWQAASDEWRERALDAEAERDEAVEAFDRHIESHDAWHEAEDIQYTRNRFTALEKAKNERIAKLEAERDEALEIRDKALGDAATFKYERDELTDKIGEITDEASELMKKQPYTFAVHDVPGSLRTVGRYIDELTAERDELKRKEKQLGNELGLRDKAIELLQDVKQELIAERDEWRARAESMLESCSTCSRFCGIDAHSKPHSTTEPSLSQLFGILSDKNDRETLDFVENPQKTGEQGRKITANEDSDSSEKLRADVEWCCLPLKEQAPHLVEHVLGWLDRQEAITKAECEESLASKNLGQLYEPRENDTREALENDAVTYCDHFACTHQRFNEAKLIALLDRQANITRRELQGEVDRLERENASLAADLAESETLRAGR